MSAITFERYTPSGFVEIVNIGTALNNMDGAIGDVNLTHMPIKSQFAVRFAGIDADLKQDTSIFRRAAE